MKLYTTGVKIQNVTLPLSNAIFVSFLLVAVMNYLPPEIQWLSLKINQMRTAPKYCQWKYLIYKSYQMLAEPKNQNIKPLAIKEPETIKKKERKRHHNNTENSVPR